MGKSYAFIENGAAIIGNDFIERRFSTENAKLITTEIINKRAGEKAQIKFKSFSAEFFVGFQVAGRFAPKTIFLSSDELTLETVNVLRRRVEFVFKPYVFSGAPITFIESVEIEDGSRCMKKYIEMMVPPEKQHLITVDYIDCEHIRFEESEYCFSVRENGKTCISEYHSTLGQPFFINGIFFGSEFPLTDNKISSGTAYIRYFSGKRFDRMRLNCGHTFKTWTTVAGAADGVSIKSVTDAFYEYIRSISPKHLPRFQYNPWFDSMLNISEKSLCETFMQIEDGLSKSLVPPLDCYVVDDGYSDYGGSFWNFNSNFPNGFSALSRLTSELSSDFGMWLGPRGGYNRQTASFAKRMEKAGLGGFNRRSLDVCVASFDYIKNLTSFMLSCSDKFDVSYWKLDGFLQKACPSKKHGHITGGFRYMYQYSEAWEKWIELFRTLRLSRESKGKKIWINQTSYCNPSPWFLQWSDSLWLQNSSDAEKLSVGGKGGCEETDADLLLNYRDSRYYDFSVSRGFKVPYEYLYNHDPVYGKLAGADMTDSEFRKYLFMMTVRGTAFWELYYSPSMLNKEKLRINSDAIRFVKNEFHILRYSSLIGGDVSKGEVYGFCAFKDGEGVVSLRNPSKTAKEYTLVLDESCGVCETAVNMRRAVIYPYCARTDDSLYSFGESISVMLPPGGCVIMKFTNGERRIPQLIYGKTEGDSVLLFFDDRIIFDKNQIFSDCEISDSEFLEDYSTLKLTFKDKKKKVSVNMTAENIYGDSFTAEFSGNFYPDNACPGKKIPWGRDFTVDFTVDSVNEDNVLLKGGRALKLALKGGIASVGIGEREKTGETALKNGDRLTLVCEPNGLFKLYINGRIECSVYDAGYINSLAGSVLRQSECVSGLKITPRALSYYEI